MQGSFGLYTHIPFCSKRCDYCAFATWVGADDQMDRYVDAVTNEIKMKRELGILPNPSSLYFGGGTPSLIPHRLITKIIVTSGVIDGSEITVECNPESTSFEKLLAYKDAGANRISFGVQSLSPQVLHSLGRSHDPTDIYRAVEAIGNAGFENYSVDVIYGAAGESKQILEDTMSKILSFSPQPSHVSAYALTVEQGTPLARDLSRYPDEDYQASAYDLIDEMLVDAGMEWYEISNWSKPEFHSRHNWNYWMQGEYVGVGCAAHSHIRFNRFWNIFNLGRYISAVEDGRDPTAGAEETTEEQRVVEALELLVRTRIGVPSEAVYDKSSIRELIHDSDGLITLTKKGRLLANQVILRMNPSSVDSDVVLQLQRTAPWHEGRVKD